MKLKEVIEICLTYLGDAEASVSKQTAEHSKIKLLIKCANIVIKEIANDYIPLKDTEIVVASGGRFVYDLLPKRVSEIFKVQEKLSGQKVSFYQKPSVCLVDKDGELVVEYSYYPFDVAIDDDCEISPKISSKTFALGVVSEYCMIEGMYEQSVMFGQKFQEEIKVACRQNKEFIVKARRWV